jgi:hypothetical protein
VSSGVDEDPLVAGHRLHIREPGSQRLGFGDRRLEIVDGEVEVDVRPT